MTTTLTATTCAANCWLAKEDACRCMCGGANHGVLLVDCAEPPARTRRIQRSVFELVSIYPGWMAANRARNSVKYAYNEEHGLQRSRGSAVTTATTKSQRKWPEVRNFLAEESNLDAYLVWRKTW